jgi:branched-chain amino acid transport system substrate-binding protein
MIFATDSFAQKAKETIKIGLMGPMSGAGAAWGIGFQRGVSLAIEDVNNAGGVKVGKKTYLLDFISADDKYTGSVALSEAGRLIFEQKIKYLIGPLGSTPVVAVSPLVNEHKVLAFVNSYTPKALGPQFPYNFRLCITSHEIAPVVWKYVKEKYGVKTAVLLGQNDETGKCETDHDIDVCNELGIKVLHRELFDLATTDFMPLMTKVVAMKPDAVEIGSAATGYVAQMAKALHELGYKGIKISNTISGEAGVIVPIIGKEACEGLVSLNLDWFSGDATPWMKEFVERYVRRYGRPFSVAAAWVYWPVFWLKDAMEKTGSLDTDVLKKYLETPGKKFTNKYGEAQFGGKKYYGVNHQIKGNIAVSEIRDGKNVMVQKFQKTPLELE